MNIYLISFCVFIFSFISTCNADDNKPSHEINILTLLHLATAASPDLKASEERTNQADATVEILKSPYYPNLELQGIQSYGFPGSTSALGIGGLMGSPYRSGPAIGFLSKYTLLDGTQRYRLKAAFENRASAKEDTTLQRIDLYQKVLRAYFDAARFRGQAELWKNIEQETDKISKEVHRFVKTGQRSIVEGLLIQDQVEEAHTAQAGYAEQYKGTLRRIALLTGQPEGALACPSIATMTVNDLPLQPTPALSPLVKKAALQAEAAEMNVSAASSERLPKVMAMGSYGEMEKARLVQEKDYSAGVGLIFPVFEGYRIAGEIRRAKSVAQEKKDDLESAKIEMDELDDRFDETIDASQVKLNFLQHELTSGQRAVTLSQQRYLDFQGSLVDVREALRNLARIQEQINDTKSDLLLAIVSKNILNSEETF